MKRIHTSVTRRRLLQSAFFGAFVSAFGALWASGALRLRNGWILRKSDS